MEIQNINFSDFNEYLISMYSKFLLNNIFMFYFRGFILLKIFILIFKERTERQISKNYNYLNSHKFKINVFQ